MQSSLSADSFLCTVSLRQRAELLRLTEERGERREEQRRRRQEASQAAAHRNGRLLQVPARS